MEFGYATVSIMHLGTTLDRVSPRVVAVRH